MKKKAFNKENPIELLSQLLKVLRRDGLEDSVDILKRHKLLKIITEEYLEVKRRVASGKPSFPKMRKGDRVPAKAIVMGDNGGDRTQSIFFQEVADGYGFLVLRSTEWQESWRDPYDMYLIDIDRRRVVESFGTHPSWRGFQSWLNHRIEKGKFDHLGGMKAASSNMRPEEIVKHLFSDRSYGEYIEEMTENALADKKTKAKLLIDYLTKNRSAREDWSRWFSGEDMNKRASEKKASPKLFEQLQFASGSERKRLLTEMSDYGVNVMRRKFDEMGLSRQEQEAVLVSALKEAQAARLKADKDSLKVFGRMRMVKFPVEDSNGEKIRLSKKLRFGIFFQLVGKGFIK